MTQYIAIENLKTWERNYRQGDVGAIVQSLQRFGFNGALRVWNNNTIIAGNHTLLALRECYRAGYDLSGEGVQYAPDGSLSVLCVDASHLNENEAQAFAIADNRTSELAYNDTGNLAELLQEVANYDDTLLLATGYDGDDLDALLKDNMPTGFPAYDEGVGGGERGKNVEESYDVFANSVVKQIVLIFGASEFDALVPRLKALRDVLGVENNTDLFMRLLEYYETNTGT